MRRKFKPEKKYDKRRKTSGLFGEDNIPHKRSGLFKEEDTRLKGADDNFGIESSGLFGNGYY